MRLAVVYVLWITGFGLLASESMKAALGVLLILIGDRLLRAWEDSR